MTATKPPLGHRADLDNARAQLDQHHWAIRHHVQQAQMWLDEIKVLEPLVADEQAQVRDLKAVRKFAPDAQFAEGA